MWPKKCPTLIGPTLKKTLRYWLSHHKTFRLLSLNPLTVTIKFSTAGSVGLTTYSLKAKKYQS